MKNDFVYFTYLKHQVVSFWKWLSFFNLILDKSRGEEWLQIAANQAKLLQHNRQTPPNLIASSSFNSSPANVDSSTSSPQHYAAYTNAVEFYPPTPAHHNLPSSSSSGGVPPSNVVAWHQSVSFDVADNFEDKWASLDNGDDKRRHSTSMGSSNVTNPFTQESSAVKIWK